MGVFKWLRRERVTVTSRHNVSSPPTTPEDSEGVDQVSINRSEQYKRDLAEFQARRSAGPKDLQTTPVKKTCGRHSLPVSCTKCSVDHDNTFNYEKKSAAKYKKKYQKRGKSSSPEKDCEGVPNIQFLFQNQVFMPGNLFPTGSFSEPQKTKRKSQHVCRSPDMDFVVQKHIDFRENDQVNSPPEFHKNSSLPYGVVDYLNLPRIGTEEIDGLKTLGDGKSSLSSMIESRDDSCEDKLWEVMSELKHFDQWADEQLQTRSANTTKSEDSKSETSAYGLPIASPRTLDVNLDKTKQWNNGKWGLVPVQIKKLPGVTAEHVKKKKNTEINILRKCRHPNIILLMGLYPDAHNNIHIICERSVDSVFGIIHVQGRILSAQTAVQYALDIANALVFLRMQGYVHTGLNSASIMVTSHDAAKLADLGPCTRLPGAEQKKKEKRDYEVYGDEPHYVNIEDTRKFNATECDPLISQNTSEVYLTTNAVAKLYEIYKHSEMYQWQAPELFMPSEDGMVYACSKSDVYSLCLILWECCNASIPWKNFNYEKLREQYTQRKVGITLPRDGTYPGCLLALLQSGLNLQRGERMDLNSLQDNLQSVKSSLDEIGYIIIPARIPNKKATGSSTAWDTTDSECLSPQNVEHKAIVHKNSRKPDDSSTESSEKDCSKSDVTPLYESIRKSYMNTNFSAPQRCVPSDDDNVEDRPVLNYEHLPEKDYSSACSTPIAKLKARYKDLGTPGKLHRSDSTEYCSILSPNRTVNFGNNDDSNKDHNSIERSATKLSRSFTPVSYKPLHIKVPEYNLDSIRPLIKSQGSAERSTYNFDIKNYSLPTTPIARSNKLRKNAWLSGEISASNKCQDKLNDSRCKSPEKDLQSKPVHSAPETPTTSIHSGTEEQITSRSNSLKQHEAGEQTHNIMDVCRDSYTGLRKVDHPQDFLSLEPEETRERANSWSKAELDRASAKYGVEEDILANVNVRPLVAIHEKWISEANKKTSRSMSLPEDKRYQIPAVKPASHCVDTFQKSLPQLNTRKSFKVFRATPVSPTSGFKNGGPWDQFSQTRDFFNKNYKSSPRDTDSFNGSRRDSDKSSESKYEPKIDQATDTQNIEEYIRSLIRKEFQDLFQEFPDDATSVSNLQKSEEILNKGLTNIIESLNGGEEEKCTKKDSIKSFSRVKINGNNKPLLQITFSRSGENSLQVLDNCVNVTLCDNNSSGREKFNVSVEDTLNEEIHINSLKRCQAFNAIQEARSTEDLYIDDDLSTQLQENFGGKVKLIPLHGSLHEILCEKEDDCCLIKVKQENGCDTIYFRCDNSDTESRDAIDGNPDNRQDTVVFKRSISLIEERIQRFVPKEKRSLTPVLLRKAKPNETKVRPKSEVFIPISKETRVLSNSSPSLAIKDDREIEVNIENAMCYQDSSSDECLKCSDNDEFELLEQKIEEDMANTMSSSLTCGCLEKISEENLSVLNDELTDRE